MYQSTISAGKKRSYRHKNTELILPDEDQRFAVVRELLGNGRLNALCDDAIVRLGRIRGSMRSGPKKMIISKGDLILVSERDFEDKVDVIHRYTHEESSYLFRKYDMPESLVRCFNMEDMQDSNEKESIVFADTDEVDIRDI